MYNSKITVEQLINSLENEVDIALQIPIDLYVNWINGVEQLLYSDIIREYAAVYISAEKGDNGIKVIDLSDIEVYDGCDDIRVSDIYTIYGYDGDEYEYTDTQLIKTEPASGAIFKNSWYENAGKINLNTEYEKVKIVYCVRPEIKTAENITIDCIMLPAEFADLIRCKLRGEMYKLVNEDALAAKWINDYNINVEMFSAWVEKRRASFGM